MEEKLNIAEFLEKARTIPVIDVRTPAEYAAGHIPGAFNIPLFTNDERAEIGTLYKQAGKQEALLRGLDIVGPKMSGFIKQAEQIAPAKKVLIHCWRGGMRSASMAWLLTFAGFETALLEKGYKAYRNAVLESFSLTYNLCILGGMTGSGKTGILQELKKQGEQVIDLEELAQHQGSAFGSMGTLIQPAQEQFENDLATQLNMLNKEQKIWLEDESITIGKLVIPGALWKQMRTAFVVKINVPKEMRISNLVRDYGRLNKEFLASCIHRITKKLGGQHAKAALDALERDDYAEVASITLTYYDKTYLTGQSGRNQENIFEITLGSTDPAANAYELLTFAKRNLILT